MAQPNIIHTNMAVHGHVGPPLLMGFLHQLEIKQAVECVHQGEPMGRSGAADPSPTKISTSASGKRQRGHVLSTVATITVIVIGCHPNQDGRAVGHHLVIHLPLTKWLMKKELLSAAVVMRCANKYHLPQARMSPLVPSTPCLPWRLQSTLRVPSIWQAAPSTKGIA